MTNNEQPNFSTQKEIKLSSASTEAMADKDELDTEKIKRLFVELPSEKVELLANHLMRPDGFAKTLITGAICSSKELRAIIDDKFVKTHRGYYTTSEPNYYSGENEYLSFNVGKTQPLYQKAGNWHKPEEKAEANGLGFSTPAKNLMERDTVSPSWGCFHLDKILEKEKNNPNFDPRLKKYSNLSEEELWKIDHTPPKEDFLTLVDLARKAGKLFADDQAEINMVKEEDNFPRLSLNETVILISAKQKETVRRYLQKKIREVQKYAPKIQEVFGVDVTKAKAEEILSQKNIYWYPQENIEIAVEYLTTHPEKIYEFLPQKNKHD
jgi:hypothetical protein